MTQLPKVSLLKSYNKGLWESEYQHMKPVKTHLDHGRRSSFPNMRAIVRIETC